ncbi:OprD family porin [Stutzerimonas nitrititolerans]|uniref:OprD family porin n=1 Tax=Stutzerimonas nitrititolerans TaxID=2482751 RepID=UPI001482AA6D|nr:OprD family porin [Stutzerimonas nitrititolerans]NNT95237.1 OprD family porin [Stutzerimonas nitrititolerans]WAD26767.1 OprD family porin [Pseudomonadaceae bacterium T75]
MKVMKWSVIAMAVAAGTSQLAFASAQSESKGFVDDASLDLLLRNTYWNRDYADGVPDRNTWAQGFIATFESGFTQGVVGFGIDAYGLLGVKLDGGQGDMFPGERKDWEDDLSEAGAAVKLRLSNSTVKYGNQFVGLPVIASDDSRLLPEAFTGTLLTSSEIEGLELNAGRFTADSPMGSPARDDNRLKSLNVFGGTYALNENLSASLYFSDVEDTYDKKYANINYVMPLAEDQSLTFDFNYYKTDDIDQRFVGRDGAAVDDNTIWSLSAKYAIGSHAFIIAHQRVSGDTGYLYDQGDGGGAIWVANSFLSDFNNKDERSWQASYELDFTGYGIPGLFWKTAYLRGDNIDAEFYGGSGEATEREFFNQVSYTFQSGAAKDLTLRARNSILRTSNDLNNDYLPDTNEWRLYAIYPLSIL